MTMAPVSLKGGDSVYCINEKQLAEATRLAKEDPESGPRIRSALETLEQSLSRNERAALSFMIIESLRNQPT